MPTNARTFHRGRTDEDFTQVVEFATGGVGRTSRHRATDAATATPGLCVERENAPLGHVPEADAGRLQELVHEVLVEVAEGLLGRVLSRRRHVRCGLVQGLLNPRGDLVGNIQLKLDVLELEKRQPAAQSWGASAPC